MRSNYKYWIQDGIIFIEDLDGGMSVTNNIENVLSEIAKNEKIPQISFYKIIYKDTDGIWDGVKVSVLGNVSFFHIGAKTKEEAINKIKNV